MIADYFFLRRCVLLPEDLYRRDGCYWYRSGFNFKALVAMSLGVLPNIVGFLVIMGVSLSDDMPKWIVDLYHYAWFVGFFVATMAYIMMNYIKKRGNL